MLFPLLTCVFFDFHNTEQNKTETLRRNGGFQQGQAIISYNPFIFTALVGLHGMSEEQATFSPLTKPRIGKTTVESETKADIAMKYFCFTNEKGRMKTMLFV